MIEIRDTQGKVIKRVDSADLRGADLSGAALCGAKGINKYLTTPLYVLQDQPGAIHAYKLVNSCGEGIYRGGIKYEVGATLTVDAWNEDESESCGSGINLATLDWCLREWQEGYQILICEFTKEDIVAIPFGSDGKFRVKRCKVIAEKPLTELGWPTKIKGTAS